MKRGVWLGGGLALLAAALWGTYLASRNSADDLRGPVAPEPARSVAVSPTRPGDEGRQPTSPQPPNPRTQSASQAPTQATEPEAHAAQPQEDPWSEPGYGMTLATLARRQAFLAADRDPEVAAAREERVAGRLGPMPEGAQLHGVECRTRGCRVIVIFDDDAALQRNVHLSRHLHRALGLNLGTERHDLTGGALSFSLYLD